MNKRSRKLILLAIVVIAATVFLISQSSKTNLADHPLIINHSPSEKNSPDGPIVIQAIEPVDPSRGTLTITPEASGETQVIDEYIIFWPHQEGFVDGTGYTVKFDNYRTTSGKEFGAMTTKFASDNSTEHTALQTEVLGLYGRTNNPFLDGLPFTEPYLFRISLLDNRQTAKPPYGLFVETLVIQGRSETIESFNANTLKAKEAATKWIKSQGVNPETDATIVYRLDYSDVGDDEFTGDGADPADLN